MHGVVLSNVILCKTDTLTLQGVHNEKEQNVVTIRCSFVVISFFQQWFVAGLCSDSHVWHRIAWRVWRLLRHVRAIILIFLSPSSVERSTLRTAREIISSFADLLLRETPVWSHLTNSVDLARAPDGSPWIGEMGNTCTEIIAGNNRKYSEVVFAASRSDLFFLRIWVNCRCHYHGLALYT